MGWLKNVRNAISDRANKVADKVTNAVNAAAETVGRIIEKVGNGIADGLHDFAASIAKAPLLGPVFGGVFKFLARLVSGVIQVIGFVLRGLINTSIAAVAGTIRITAGLVAFNPKLVIKGIRGTGESVFGSFIGVSGAGIGLVQGALFIQRRERPLTELEYYYLQRVYRTSVALDDVRIIDGWSGLFMLSSRAFTLGNRIYAKATDLSKDLETLVHESGHVWQYQHDGTAYIGGALFAYWTQQDDAYEWTKEHAAGKAWKDFNKEAQAEFVADVFSKGSGGSTTGLGAFYEDDPLGPAAHFAPPGGPDFTDFARASIAYLRAA